MGGTLSVGYKCPYCDAVTTYEHNLRTHLRSCARRRGHALSDSDLEQVIATVAGRSADAVQPTTALGGRHARRLDAGTPPVREGHYRMLEQIEHPTAYPLTRQMYARHVGTHGVYLRLTDAGFTVLSLDFDRCGSMIGVGAPNSQQHRLRVLPPSESAVAAACRGYERKLAALARSSEEEPFSLRVVAGALNGDLSIERAGTFFVQQEWRLPSGERLDVLAVEPDSGRFVVVELKASEREARTPDPKKGGDAWQQAESYADQLYEERKALYPFFERLARALARHHHAPESAQRVEIDLEHRPLTCVAWPGSGYLAVRGS